MLVTALRTLEEERNFVNMAASSTSSPSILMVLNGPIREALGINSRDGLFGPGFRANASIGRGGAAVLYERFRRLARPAGPWHPGHRPGQVHLLHR